MLKFKIVENERKTQQPNQQRDESKRIKRNRKCSIKDAIKRHFTKAERFY